MGQSLINHDVVSDRTSVYLFILVNLIFHRPATGAASLTYQFESGYCRSGYTNYREDERAEKLIVYFLTRGLTYIISVLITLLAYVEMMKTYRTFSPEVVRANNLNGLKLLIYPIFQILVYTPNALQMLVTIWDKPSQLWTIVVTITVGLSGFINFILYGRQFIRPNVAEARNPALMELSFENRTSDIFKVETCMEESRENKSNGETYARTESAGNIISSFH